MSLTMTRFIWMIIIVIIIVVNPTILLGVQASFDDFLVSKIFGQMDRSVSDTSEVTVLILVLKSGVNLILSLFGLLVFSGKTGKVYF